jgi:predicted transposase YbfD/YdcC
MAVGSSFDAYVKSFIEKALFGTVSPEFEFDALFTKQVEPHNRDSARASGAICFQAYRESGSLDDLLQLLRESPTKPKMEFTVTGGSSVEGFDENGNVYRTVTMTQEAHSLVHGNDVVILGKPDLYFQTKDGTDVIFDWKVNGYYSKSGKSPTPGYLLYKDGFNPKSRNHGKTHADAIPYNAGNMEYSLHPNLEQVEPTWARQLSAYSWLCGSAVGSSLIAAVDQLCCKPSFPTAMISVAQHRCCITSSFQIEAYNMFQTLWSIVQSDHIFRHLTPEESQERIRVLIQQNEAYKGDDQHTKWLNSIRGGSSWQK